MEESSMTEKKNSINKREIIVGIVLLLFSILSILWMSGFFMVPSDFQSASNSSLQEWSAPGFLAFPFAISIIAGIAGAILILKN
jgi:hypothetical protein